MGHSNSPLLHTKQLGVLCIFVLSSVPVSANGTSIRVSHPSQRVHLQHRHSTLHLLVPWSLWQRLVYVATCQTISTGVIWKTVKSPIAMSLRVLSWKDSCEPWSVDAAHTDTSASKDESGLVVRGTSYCIVPASSVGNFVAREQRFPAGQR